MPIFKLNRFTLSILILAFMLFILTGCSEMGTDPALPVPIPAPEDPALPIPTPGVLNPEATPIEIPGPETEEFSEDQDSPEATPIEIPEGETEEDPYEIPVEETEEDPYATPIEIPDATPTEEPEEEADIL